MWRQESSLDGSSYLDPRSTRFLSGASSPPRDRDLRIPQDHSTSTAVDKGKLQERSSGGDDGSGRECSSMLSSTGPRLPNRQVVLPIMGSFPSSSPLIHGSTALIPETSDFSSPPTRTTSMDGEVVTLTTSSSTVSDTSKPQSTASTSPSPTGTIEQFHPPPPTESSDSTESEQLIARISIPESHRDQFIQVLLNSPDLNFRIKKKSVRFDKTTLESVVPTSSSRSVRR